MTSTILMVTTPGYLVPGAAGVNGEPQLTTRGRSQAERREQHARQERFAAIVPTALRSPLAVDADLPSVTVRGSSSALETSP
ncbi:hypothetical protein [Streptoalloteichus hindustanus]|uniref:Uncharacterized protein n=1 Tax=Streptoalloteichus hindustanus TaxID=2017 RepID=A0A1M5JA65_STRHI|nr:hypothetical protein [Streptoalloteichus hindustanus]SHG37464.1 hypothetical protein SAMN05444320_108197 [Streptoalloteichus hindustanus]